jgi:hypothetical protein
MQPPFQPQQPQWQQQPYPQPSQQLYDPSSQFRPSYTPSPQAIPPMPPPPAPKKKSRTWLWIMALVVVFFFGVGVGNTGHSSSTTTPDTSSNAGQPTTAPTKPQSWQTTHTFTGNGAKKTETFTVADDWKISWSCQGIYGTDAPLFISVAGDVTDPNAASTSCKAAGPKTTGSTEEHQGGKVYLDINSGIDWTITIQELK